MKKVVIGFQRHTLNVREIWKKIHTCILKGKNRQLFIDNRQIKKI